MRRRRVCSAVAAGILGVASAVFMLPARASATSYTAVSGGGSSYAGLAFQTWVSDGGVQGLPVNYTPSSSPQGLIAYANGILPFAGTEAEFAALTSTPDSAVDFQYTPDVAGATAVMYNANDQAGRPVTYLHLSQRTVARIFMGLISNWDSPEISADNLGLVLPNHIITVVYRSGQSGTTSLFYDFVAHADPQDFVPWANANGFPTQTRIIALDNGHQFAPSIEGFGASDQEAETVASTPWTISYDEFAYPKTYHAQVAWIRNGGGKWTQPYAINITAALESATLNANLSQNLDGVYTSTNPIGYPISAYSYIVTQCAPDPAVITCKHTYSDSGQAATLGTWMSYIACAGQVQMAQTGYAPLPPGLSQDVAAAVGRITGQPPVTLTAANCANPRFQGLLGVGAAGPPDPYIGVASLAPVSGGSQSGTAGGAAGATNATGGAGRAAGQAGARAGATGGPGATAATGGPGGVTAAGSVAASASNGTVTAVGKAGGPVAAVGGGSGQEREAAPVAYDRPVPGPPPVVPLLALLAVLVVPALVLGSRRRST